MIPPAVFLGVIELMHVADLVKQYRPDWYAMVADAIRFDRVQDINWQALSLPPFPDMPIVEPPEPLAPLIVGIDPEALVIMARTMWGEARNQPFVGIAAVGHVIMNRVRQGGWWGNDIMAVCKHPKQFSVWNAGDRNRPKMLAVTTDDPAFRQCLAAASAVLTGLEPDPTLHATHYHARSVNPAWARGQQPTVVIGDHLFYAGIS